MAQRKTRSGGLAKAISAAGSVTALTEKLNKAVGPKDRLTVQAVSQWDSVPAERCLDIERVTGVSRHDLRPDVFGRQPQKRVRPRSRAGARAEPQAA